MMFIINAITSGFHSLPLFLQAVWLATGAPFLMGLVIGLLAHSGPQQCNCACQANPREDPPPYGRFVDSPYGQYQKQRWEYLQLMRQHARHDMYMPDE